MTKQFLVGLLVLGLLAGPVVADPAVDPQAYFIHISGIDADWDFTDDYPARGWLRVSAVQFNPGASGDELVIKHGADTGSPWVHLISEDGSQRVASFGAAGQVAMPYIDYSACTLSAGHSVIFYLMP